MGTSDRNATMPWLRDALLPLQFNNILMPAHHSQTAAQVRVKYVPLFFADRTRAGVPMKSR